MPRIRGRSSPSSASSWRNASMSPSRQRARASGLSIVTMATVMSPGGGPRGCRCRGGLADRASHEPASARAARCVLVPRLRSRASCTSTRRRLGRRSDGPCPTSGANVTSRRIWPQDSRNRARRPICLERPTPRFSGRAQRRPLETAVRPCVAHSMTRPRGPLDTSSARMRSLPCLRLRLVAVHSRSGFLAAGLAGLPARDRTLGC